MDEPAWLFRPFRLVQDVGELGPAQARAALAHINAALRHSGGTHVLSDVVDGLRSGRMQLWLGERSAVVTMHHVYPRLSVVELFAAGGDLDELFSFIPQISAAARAIGATRLQMGGRKGWGRFADRLGWRTQLHAYKELADG